MMLVFAFLALAAGLALPPQQEVPQGWMSPAQYSTYIDRLRELRDDGYDYDQGHHGHAFFNIFEQTANCSVSLDRYPPGRQDGGKYVCDYEQIKAPCVIYSIGSDDNWLFEVAMQPTGCQIFTFDCFGDYSQSAPANVTFKKWCVGGRDRAPFYTIPSMMKMLGHERIEYLKIDVEGAEFNALPALMELPKEKRPKQLGVEIHSWLFVGRTRSHPTIRATFELLLTLHDLGYRLVSREDNIYSYSCSEFLYILV